MYLSPANLPTPSYQPLAPTIPPQIKLISKQITKKTKHRQYLTVEAVVCHSMPLCPHIFTFKCSFQ